MSDRCWRCFRPVRFCLCKYAEPVDAGVKFVLLMHPKEAKRERTGTGRIAHVSLADERYFPVLLYPGKDAHTVRTEGFTDLVGDKTLLVIVIDATWFCSRKVIEHSAFLLDLPRLSFAGSYRSEFTFKREPSPDYISTIESCYYLIKELQAAHLANENANPEPLMTAFRKLIRDQLQAQNDRIDGKLPDTHSYNWKYTKKVNIPKT